MNQLMTMMQGSVPTGDERNVTVWIIIAAAALLLVIATAVLSFISKKK